MFLLNADASPKGACVCLPHYAQSFYCTTEQRNTGSWIFNLCVHLQHPKDELEVTAKTSRTDRADDHRMSNAIFCHVTLCLVNKVIAKGEVGMP